MNDDDADELDPKFGSKQRRRRVGSPSWKDLQVSWRRWFELSPNLDVEPSTIQSFLNVLVREVELSFGSDPRPLERLKEHVIARRVHTGTAVGSTTESSPVPAVLPPADVSPRGVLEPAAPQRAVSAPAEHVHVNEVSGNLSAPATFQHVAHSNDAQTKAFVSAVKTEFQRSFDQHRNALSSFIQKLEVLSQAASQESRGARSSTEAQREQLEVLAARVVAASHSIDRLSSEQNSLRQQMLGAAAETASGVQSTNRRLDELQAQISRRIDLDDAKQVLRLRQEVERVVKAELIRNVSHAIVPALGVLKDALAAGDTAAIDRAVTTLQKRCEQAGLIMDQNHLF
jgi:hypothetical protein